MKYLVRCFLLICLLLINGCQPVEMAVPSLAGLVAYPFVQLKEAFEQDSDDFYQKTKKERGKRSLESEALHCQSNGLPLTDEMQKILKQVNLAQCVGCKALDIPACSDQACNCSKLCPDWCNRVCPNNFEILKQSREMAIPYKEHNIDIVNSRKEFGDPKVFGGYCNGITQLTKRMSALASFKPSEKPRNSTGQVITSERELAFFYKQILMDLAAGKARDVPAFASIYEFTSDPFIQPYVRAAIRQTWSAAFFYNPFLVESAGVYTSIEEDDFQSAKQDIKKLIEMTGSAQVTLSMDDETGNGNGHTVEVYHVYELEEDGAKLTMGCLNNSNTNRRRFKSKAEWEKNPVNTAPNAPADVYCPEPMVLKREKKGEPIFRRNIKVDNMDKRSAVDHIDTVRKKCQKDRGCD